MKLIFVTGGVISGLGKGITAASIGTLLKSAGYNISIIKLDPYLNVDAGTMSPYEHGEVFVTDDGHETDLDLGHYSRFIDVPLSIDNSITTGKVYKRVLDKEREGAYLGDDIQVIPHVVNEVKEMILNVAKDYDILLVEIGGTIGDIEGPHFTEAARQLKRDLGKDNVLYIHVVLLLYLNFSKEFKTKPIQHSYKELTRLGIQPDIMMCRSGFPIPQGVKEKISLFCNIDLPDIIENVNCESIYQVPLQLQRQNIDKIVQEKLGLTQKLCQMENRNNRVARLISAEKKVVIGMVGKYAAIQDSYISVVESLKHACAAHGVKLILEWIHAEDFEDEYKHLAVKDKIDGLIIPGGFGTRGMEGKIAAARFAMEHQIPYLGLCLGLQMAVVAFARYRCGLDDAHTVEAQRATQHPVITFMPGQHEELAKGGTMRLGAYDAILTPGTKVYELYKAHSDERVEQEDGLLISERHRHRYEVNPLYVEVLQKNGLIMSGVNPYYGVVEFIELPDHPFFVATQAHPEFKSRLDKPHPLFWGLIEACVR